jgi:peptidylprolyl isomerase domain and WD repeat-containing protein 1
MAVSYNGVLMCTLGDDKSVKVFEVTNFDMINMIRLVYTPKTAAWVRVRLEL